MGKLKRFFKHKFVIVSMCLMLVGALTLTIMAFIPKAKVYTNKDTVEYEHMGEKVTYRLTFEDDKHYYIDYVNEEGKVVQEKAITGTYEIKDGVLYSALGKWGKISVYGIDVKFAGILDAGYENKPAKYARLASIGVIVLGGLMFVLAAYVGITKKKPKVANAPSPAMKSHINVAKQAASQEPNHNPLARKLPQGARKIQRPINRPQSMDNRVDSESLIVAEPQINNHSEVVENQPNSFIQEEIASNYVQTNPYVQTEALQQNQYIQPEETDYIDTTQSVQPEIQVIEARNDDAYDNLIRAIEEDAMNEYKPISYDETAVEEGEILPDLDTAYDENDDIKDTE